MDIAQKVKSLADHKRVSLQKLATQIGVTKEGLYKMIRENSFKVDTLQKIAVALGVPVIDFFEPGDDYRGDIIDSEALAQPDTKRIIAIRNAISDLSKLSSIEDHLEAYIQEIKVTKHSLNMIVEKMKKDKAYTKDKIIAELEELRDTYNYLD